MKEKFEFIVLPPDAYHMTLRDRLADARNDIQEALDVINAIRRPEDKVIVKYRVENQRKLFPTAAETRVGYGALLDLCRPDTIVVGKPGSATWECLLNDISFYTFWDLRRYQSSQYYNQKAISRLSRVLQIAKTGEELLANIRQGAIYQPGRSKSDLIHGNGMPLADIISAILAHRNRKHA